MKCEICGNVYEKLNGLAKHLSLTHNISGKDYYDTYIKKNGEGICPVCGKETSFRNNWEYLKFCSYKCAHQTLYWDYEKYNKTKSEFYKEIADKNKDKLKQISNSKTEQTAKNILTTNKIKLIKIDNYRIYNCCCEICGTEFQLDKYKIFYNKRNNLPLCTNCFPKNPKLEEDFFNFFKEFNYSIITHERKILDGKELDLYIPELKLAFEFDGTYWHADPRFFKDTDIIRQSNKTAKEIWEYDNNKIIQAKEKGITLYRIKEFEWKNDKENTKEYIRRIVNESSTNC